MKSPQRPAKSRQTTTALQIKTQDAKPTTRSLKRRARYALLVFLLLAAGTLAALPGASFATRKRVARTEAVPEVAHASMLSREVRRVAPSIASPASLVPLNYFFFDPPIATYAADCTTPKNSFNLGDTVCVKISDTPIAGAAVAFTDPDEFVRGTLAYSATALSYSFVLPSAASSGDGVDNRGTWTAALINTEDNSRRVIARFAVHDPAHNVADVTISKTSLDIDQVVAGSNATYRIYVTNQGPDAGTNVSFTDNTMPNTTFVSFTDNGSSGFNCTSPTVGTAGSTVCTKSTMAVGETASFTAVYKLNGSVANGTDLTDTTTITSDTTDSHPSSNSSTVDTTVTNPTTPTCSLTCPSNVAVIADSVENFDADNDPDTPPTPTSGAHVTLPAAQSSGSTCGTVTSSIPSGSFFPVGSTPVTYTAADGTTCSFVVTVTTSGSPVSISCPANVAANADADCEVAVAIGTPATTGDNVTVTSSRSDGKPMNAPFTSGVTTITWTASNSSGTESCTQTVTIIDVTPPVVNVPNPAPVSADANCQAVIPDLTASPGITDNCACDSSDSAESCAGHSRVAVTQSPAPGTVVGLGPHTITLTANDGSDNNAGAGNTTTAQVTFTVNDTTPPVITRNGASPLTWECHVPFTDPGATASDACDTSVPVIVSGTVNANVVGTYTLTYNASDDSGNAATPVTRTVNVVDTIPPTLTLNSYAPSMWPPNHKYTTFRVTDFVTAVSDSCSTALGVGNVVIEKVTSDEPDNGGGDGDTANDMVLAADCKSVQLRSERNGSGDGRVYIITFKVSDGTNVTRKTAKVIVPHDQGHGGSAVDSGVHNTVNGSCP